MDYDRLIDADIHAFIRKTAEYYPDDAVHLSIEEQRQVYDRLCAAFRRPRPHGVEATDLTAGGVPVRLYSAGMPSRTVVYFHGGGFVLGGLDSHDDICAEICANTGYRVAAVDYRLSPEHRHPAAFDDALNATLWAASSFGDDMVLAGDSAGANLAAAVVGQARSRRGLSCIVGQVLIYGALGGDPNTGSYIEHADAPMLTRDDIQFYNRVRFDGPAPAADPTHSPLHLPDFDDLPPTVLVTADCDPVRDDSRIYRDKVLEAGGRALWINEEGLVHGYLRARTMSTKAAASFERIVLAIEALGQGLWPWD